MSTRKQLVVAFVALMVLFSGVAMVAGAAVASPTTVSTQDDSNDDGPDDTDTDDTDEDDDAAAEPTASVTFSDQTTDGTTVVVDEVTMDEGGFVTIHDSSLLVGNVIESVIGVSEYLEAGTHEDVEIELDETLEEDETLIAMPHLDTNDNQEYDFVETEGVEDGPYVDEDGEPVTDDAAVTLEEEEAEEEEAEEEEAEEEEAEEEEAEEEEAEEEEAEEEEAEEEEAEEEEAEEEEAEEDETVVMEPDYDAVEDGVTIVQQQATYVFIENLTIEELIIENAEVYVFVISDDADLDRLEEILEGEVDMDETEVDDPEEDETEVDDPEEDETEVDDPEEDDDAAPEPTASVMFSDQTTDGATVVVDEVTMDEGGFVTIHDSSLLDGEVFESVVGVSDYLEEGTHEDVEIELDESLEEDETLIAMPHLDTNDNQEYDFVETEGAEDGPYVDEDGEAVTDDAEVTLEEEEAPEDETDEDETDEDETDEDETDEDETDEDETDEDETDEDETDEDETDEDETDEDETDEDETDEDVEEAVSFTIDDLEAPENATVGDVITVNATITNPGEEEATQDVQFRLDGNLVESQSLTLGPEESETVTFEVDTADLEPGEYVHMVLTDDFGQVAFLTLEAADDATDEEPDDDGEETDENETGEEDNGEADRLAPIGALSPL